MNPNRARNSKKFLTDMLSGCRTEEQCEVVNYIPFCRPDLCQKNVECIQDPTDIETLCVSTTRMPGLSSKNWIFYRVLFIAPATQVFYGSCPSGFQKAQKIAPRWAVLAA